MIASLSNITVQHLTLFICLSFLVTACSGTRTVNKSDAPSGSEPIEYTLVYMIHGDANYLYHQNGEAFKADQQALEEAYEVALNAVKGEVFIFHQKPERKAALFFPKKDRNWYHYKNGKLVGFGKYSPDTGGLTAEANIFSENKSTGRVKTYFMYFGHEIPQNSDEIYYSSKPEFHFDTKSFSRDLTLFGDEIALTVLSTCNNGNPLMIRELTGKTDAVVASPVDLHLSYIDTKNLLILEENPEMDVVALADSISHDSYNRLSREVNTTVTLAVYDLRIISEYVDDMYEPFLEYKSTTSAGQSELAESKDCLSLPQYAHIKKTDGVQVFYKAPQFGVKKGAEVSHHSGWGCK